MATCSPTSELCSPCVDEDVGQTYCSSNSFKQEVKCVVNGLQAANGSAAASQMGTNYITFQACPVVPGDFLGIVKFELLMLIFFAFSFRFVQKRKRQRTLAQLARIESYDSAI